MLKRIKTSAKMCFFLVKLRRLSIGSIISKSLWGLGLFCTIVTGSIPRMADLSDFSLGKLYKILRTIIDSYTVRITAR